MTTENFDWKAGLADLFAASVNQQTLEEAAELMVSVSSVDSRYHERCLMMLREGIRSANMGDSVSIDCVNMSGYRVFTAEDAAKLLEDFYTIYLKEYERAVK